MRDYLAADPRAAAFFGGSPWRPERYATVFRRVRGRFDRAARARAAQAIRPTSPSAAKRIESFVNAGGAFVVTGQQAGLFTGPLYTIYKILGAIILARRLARELNTLVLPLFWIASEDHDWAEVDHTHVIGADGDLHRVQVAPAEGRGRPMHDRVFTADVERAVGELLQHIDRAEETASLFNLLRGAYRNGATVSEAFRETITRLFAHANLLVVDAADPALKQASAPVLEAAITDAAEHEKLVEKRTGELLAAGYHAQVDQVPGAAHLFYHGAGGRERLQWANGRWRAPIARESWSPGELRARVRAEPNRFSPNVLLRPVVENAVFPVLAYVAGPGEIAYLAQAAPLFPALDLKPPVVYPRPSATIVDRRAARALRRLGVDASELSRPVHELETRLARAAMPEGIDDALSALRREIAAAYEELITEASSLDPTLAGPLGANRNAALRGADRSAQKALRAVKRRDEWRLRQLRLARTYFYPKGQPQERVVNVFSFLAHSGGKLLADLEEAFQESMPLLSTSSDG